MTNPPRSSPFRHAFARKFSCGWDSFSINQSVVVAAQLRTVLWITGQHVGPQCVSCERAQEEEGAEGTEAREGAGTVRSMGCNQRACMVLLAICLFDTCSFAVPLLQQLRSRLCVL